MINFGMDKNGRELTNALNLYKKKKIPEIINLSDDYGIWDLELRRQIIPVAGFPLLTQAWIRPLSKWIGKRKVLEIMAGCGSITFALENHGVDIIATDNFSWKSHKWNTWTNIENIDCIEAIKKYTDREIILCSWAYMDDILYNSLLELRKTNRLLIYIGEDKWGCCANDDFFNNVEIIEDKQFEEINKKFKSYDCIHDYIALCK